jgi:SAM-dependent methyltransferase
MNPAEYVKLDRIDRDHWFYRGKRAIVRRWIERSVRLTPDDLLIDAGMGTGRWLEEMAGTCRILGVDDHDESIEMARPRVEAAGGQCLKAPLHQVDLPDGTATVITAMDVLEHIEDDRAALAELVRLTRPGGLIVLTVPALRWLWSDWDVVLHHYRRYHKADLRKLIDSVPGVEIERCEYFNAALLPAIWLVRSWRKLVPLKPGAPRAEDAIPPGPANEALFRLLSSTGTWSWFRPPAGVSLLAVLRRTGETSNSL